jgi:putative molybdopterin biosynthesis protein
LIALRQGLSDIAGCHLLDAASGEYNLPYVRHLFPDRAVSVVTLVHREQGLVVPEGNPKRLSGIEDLARPDVRIVNRNAGSGTRVWIDQRLREAVASTHDEVAEAVELGTADAGIAIRAVAEARGLGFVSLFEERYDLVFAEDRVAQQPVLQEMLGRLEGGAFRRAVKKLPGYGTEETGHVEQLVG